MIHSNFFEQGSLYRLECKSKSCKNLFDLSRKLFVTKHMYDFSWRQKVKKQLESICKSYAKRLLNFLFTLRDSLLK